MNATHVPREHRPEGAPVPRPVRLVVSIHQLDRKDWWRTWAAVLVDMQTGETSPPDVRLPPPGWTVTGGTVEEGMGADVCGLGGRHRWVLEAAEATHRRGAADEQLVLG